MKKYIELPNDLTYYYDINFYYYHYTQTGFRHFKLYINYIFSKYNSESEFNYNLIYFICA